MKPELNLKLIRKRIVKEYLGNNLRRFQRRHHKQYYFEAIYSDYISKWKTQPYKRVIVKQMLKKLIWPKHVVDIVNIMRTLYMYYGYEYDAKCAKVAWDIHTYFERDIYEYNKKKYTWWITNMGFATWPKMSAKKALKEQKARGFIHLNKYDDFDRKASHVVSIANDNYVYPMNFYHFTKHWDYQKRGDMEIYIGSHLVGVSGYTKTVIPGIPKN